MILNLNAIKMTILLLYNKVNYYLQELDFLKLFFVNELIIYQIMLYETLC